MSRLQRDIHQSENILQNAFGMLGGALAENNARVDNDSVGEDGYDQAFDIVRKNVIAALK